jgi:NAD-dependent deacetylase
MRPDVVLFDEWLNDDVYNNALKKIQEADLLIAIGSSLVVMPACDLIKETNKDCKKILINNQPTPLDNTFDLVIRENCGEVLDNVIQNFS